MKNAGGQKAPAFVLLSKKFFDPLRHKPTVRVTGSPEEDLSDVIDVFVQTLELADRFSQRHSDDGITTQGSHIPPLTRAHHVIGFYAKTRRQNPIERCW